MKLKFTYLSLAGLLLSSVVAMAQIQVSGTVYDSSNLGIPGAGVLVKGTTTGAITDIDGNYTVTVPDASTTLVFSCLGYTDQEIVVGSQSVINVVLKDDSQKLDEVVVVAYGSARKKDLTGALTSMRPSDEDAMKAGSLDNLLNGKVAGLVVSSASSTPGAASSVTIRGASSLRGDNQPLYVIDNIPQSSTGEFAESGQDNDYQIAQDPLANLNPADIESITVLKDASSTAIYGSRGANGVILITTKKGSQGKPKVMVSANYTLAQPTRLMDVLDLETYAAYANSRVVSGGTPFHIVGNEVRYVYSNVLDEYDANNPSTYNVVTNRDWQKEIYRTAFSQKYGVAVSGGTPGATYYVSANFQDVNGVVKQTGLKQGNLRANIGAKFGDRVDMKLALAGAIRRNNMMAGGNTLGGSTTAVSRTALDYVPFEMPDGDPSLTDLNKTTVFSWLDDYEDIAVDQTFNASMELTWRITDKLRYDLRTGGNLNNNDRKRWWGLELYQGMNNQGYLIHSNLSKSNYSVENIFTYTTTFGENITFDATAGATYEDYNWLNKNVVGTNFSITGFRENGMHMASSILYKQPVQKDYQLMSFLGRVNLGLYDKYLFTASLRADGSSKFAKGHRWGYFPSASFAWIASQEDFIRSIEPISFLKFRLSYGVTGNQSIDPYSTFSMYGGGDIIYADPYGNALTTMVVTNLENDGLTWEKTSTIDLGMDFGLFGDVLSGTIDYYRKKTKDLLVARSLPGSSGFSTTYYNEGELTNNGVELTLNANIIKKNDLKWTVGGNIGFNKTKITKLGLDPSDFGALGEQTGYLGNFIGDHFGYGHIFMVGYAPGLFYGYKTNGIVSTSDLTTVTVDGAEVAAVKYIKADGSTGYYTSVNGVTPSAGDVNFVDVNEDGIIDETDRTTLGDPNPDFTYGFNTNLSYKNLSFSASFQGVHGRDIMNTGLRYIGLPGQGNGANILRKAYDGMWTATNDATATYPSSIYSAQKVVYDRFIEDGSYLRCSDITISYSLPSLWISKIGCKYATISASVKNAFIITKYSGYDPEVNSFAFDGLRPGVDMNSYPTPRSFIFGLNLTF